MKKVIFLASILLLAAGCGHNTSMFFSGFAARVGLDAHNNYVPTASIVDGLQITDISRENSVWIIEVNSETGLILNKDGSIKGVKVIRRSVGPQITGYLVDLAKSDPALAKAYADAIKAYWEAQKWSVK